MKTEEILVQLIGFYPITSNQDNVLSLLKYAKKILSENGLDGTIHTHNGVHMLYANTQNEKHSKILLQSHVDVVPCEPELRKARIRKGRLFGRGARDMLFAAASYLAFVQNNQQLIKKLNVGILLTGDEEVGGRNTIPRALELGYRSDVVVLPDAGNNLTEIVTRAKGVYNFDLTVTGIAHHGSRPWEGDAATHKLIKLLTELTGTFPVASNETTGITITQLAAGDSVNKGPAKARAHIDIRYTTKTDLKKYQHILDQLCKKYSGTLSNVVIEPNYNLDLNSPLVQKFITVNQDTTGEQVQSVTVSGSSDARYFAEKNIPVIMTRPLSAGSHSDDEWVDIESLQMFYEIMQTYILEVGTIEG